MNPIKSKEREVVDSMLDAMVGGKVRINPDGWSGSKLDVRFTSPADVLNDLKHKFRLYVEAGEPQKEEMVKQLYGDIINARLGGLLVGETGPVSDVEKLTRENEKLREDIKKLLAVATGQGTGEAGPYQ
jgi:hypothetical protein